MEAVIDNPSAARGSETATLQTTRLSAILTNIGTGILRYGLVGILLYYGFAKFYKFEADGIQGFIGHSPFFSWMNSILSVQAVSNIIGSAEIIFAILIALRFFSAGLSAVGSAGAIIMTLSTLSFLFTTPGTFMSAPGFPIPITSSAGAFLLKDVFLLGAAVLTAGEALSHIYRRRTHV